MSWTPAELIKISGDFWTSSALHSAVELDFFSALAQRPLTVAGLSARTGCSERGIAMLATVMAALKLVEHEDGAYSLTPFSRQYLCRDSRDYLGFIIGHHRHLVAGWARLSEAVRSGGPVAERVSATPLEEERENFLLGMANMSSLQASQCVPLIDIGDRKKLLDLGGGPGSYAIQFCLEHEGMSAVVFDQPTSQSYAENMIARHGLADRVAFHPGDFTKDELPSGFDVAWLSHILHGEGPETAGQVVLRAARALNPGGMLLIHEFIVDDDGNGPLFSGLFGLNMLINTQEGMAYTESELAEFLRNAGALDITRLDLGLPNGRGVMRGIMPSSR